MQQTEYNNTLSLPLTITIGIPQGSILGPLIFIIYVNDFPHASTLFHFIMYADDTTLFSTIEALSPNPNDVSNVINDELCKVDKWLQINKRSLNIQKSKFIIYKKTNKKTDPILQIKHTAIERVDHFNFLGLTIDSQLTWKNHIYNTANKYSSHRHPTYRLKYVVPLHITILLYNSMILPHLNYCLTAWGFNCKRILNLQKKVIRIITLSKFNAHTDPLLKSSSYSKLQIFSLSKH